MLTLSRKHFIKFNEKIMKNINRKIISDCFYFVFNQIKAVSSLFLLASLSLTSVLAQNATVRGVVQDSNQETIIGASVTL